MFFNPDEWPVKFSLGWFECQGRLAEEITRWCSDNFGERSIGTRWEHDLRYGRYLWWIARREDQALFRLAWGHLDMELS